MILTDMSAYFKAKRPMWSASTYRSELARAHVFVPVPRLPETLMESATRDALKPYSIKTLFIRIRDIWKYYDKEIYALYDEYMKGNRLFFSRAHTKTYPVISFKEAVQRIEALKSVKVKNELRAMLFNGLRVSEGKLSESGKIVGKGGKLRDPLFPELCAKSPRNVSYMRIYRALKSIGLKPHDLRKLAATEYWREGDLTAMELCKIFGWEKLETASSYIAPLFHEEIVSKVSAHLSLKGIDGAV